jgi:tetratricopeptide (TPR) repeat protein
MEVSLGYEDNVYKRSYSVPNLVAGHGIDEQLMMILLSGMHAHLHPVVAEMAKLYSQRLRDLHDEMQKEFEVERRELKRRLKHAEATSGKVKGYLLEAGPEEFKMGEGEDGPNAEMSSILCMYGNMGNMGSATQTKDVVWQAYFIRRSLYQAISTKEVAQETDPVAHLEVPGEALVEPAPISNAAALPASPCEAVSTSAVGTDEAESRMTPGGADETPPGDVAATQHDSLGAPPRAVSANAAVKSPAELRAAQSCPEFSVHSAVRTLQCRPAVSASCLGAASGLGVSHRAGLFSGLMPVRLPTSNSSSSYFSIEDKTPRDVDLSVEEHGNTSDVTTRDGDQTDESDRLFNGSDSAAATSAAAAAPSADASDDDGSHGDDEDDAVGDAREGVDTIPKTPEKELNPAEKALQQDLCNYPIKHEARVTAGPDHALADQEAQLPGSHGELSVDEDAHVDRAAVEEAQLPGPYGTPSVACAADADHAAKQEAQSPASCDELDTHYTVDHAANHQARLAGSPGDSNHAAHQEPHSLGSYGEPDVDYTSDAEHVADQEARVPGSHGEPDVDCTADVDDATDTDSEINLHGSDESTTTECDAGVSEMHLDAAFSSTSVQGIDDYTLDTPLDSYLGRGVEGSRNLQCKAASVTDSSSNSPPILVKITAASVGIEAFSSASVHTSLPGYERVSCLKEQGHEALGIGDVTQAIDHWLHALDEVALLSADKDCDIAELTELRVSLLLNISLGLKQQNKWAEAVKICDEVLQVQPQHSKALYRKADALSHLGMWVDAEQVISLLNKTGWDSFSRGWFTAQLKSAASRADEKPKQEEVPLQIPKSNRKMEASLQKRECRNFNNEEALSGGEKEQGVVVAEKIGEKQGTVKTMSTMVVPKPEAEEALDADEKDKQQEVPLQIPNLPFLSEAQAERVSTKVEAHLQKRECRHFNNEEALSGEKEQGVAVAEKIGSENFTPPLSEKPGPLKTISTIFDEKAEEAVAKAAQARLKAEEARSKAVRAKAAADQAIAKAEAQKKAAQVSALTTWSPPEVQPMCLEDLRKSGFEWKEKDCSDAVWLAGLSRLDASFYHKNGLPLTLVAASAMADIEIRTEFVVHCFLDGNLTTFAENHDWAIFLERCPSVKSLTVVYIDIGEVPTHANPETPIVVPSGTFLRPTEEGRLGDRVVLTAKFLGSYQEFHDRCLDFPALVTPNLALWADVPMYGMGEADLARRLRALSLLGKKGVPSVMTFGGEIAEPGRSSFVPITDESTNLSLAILDVGLGATALKGGCWRWNRFVAPIENGDHGIIAAHAIIGVIQSQDVAPSASTVVELLQDQQISVVVQKPALCQSQRPVSRKESAMSQKHIQAQWAAFRKKLEVEGRPCKPNALSKEERDQQALEFYQFCGCPGGEVDMKRQHLARAG